MKATNVNNDTTNMVGTVGAGLAPALAPGGKIDTANGGRGVLHTPHVCAAPHQWGDRKGRPYGDEIDAARETRINGRK